LEEGAVEAEAPGEVALAGLAGLVVPSGDPVTGRRRFSEKEVQVEDLLRKALEGPNSAPAAQEGRRLDVRDASDQALVISLWEHPIHREDGQATLAGPG